MSQECGADCGRFNFSAANDLQSHCKSSKITSQPLWHFSAIDQLFASSETIKSISHEFYSHHPFLKHDNITNNVLRGQWDVWYLMEEGQWASRITLQEHFPKTWAVLQQMQVCEMALGYVYFSRLAPGTVVNRHCGPTNTKLRVQVPLLDNMDIMDVRAARRALGRLYVGDEHVDYEVGRVVVFDDSFVHRVEVSEEGERVVLLVDIWHPELGEKDRQLISAAYPITRVHFAADVVIQGDDTDEVPSANAVETFSPAENNHAVALRIADEDVVIQNVLKVANEVLDDHQSSSVASAVPVDFAVDDLNLKHGGDSDCQIRRTDNRAVISAESVFVSPPTAGDAYSNHRLSVMYAKVKEQGSTAAATADESSSSSSSSSMQFTILMLGDYGAGKTSFAARACDQLFPGVEYRRRTVGYSCPFLPYSQQEPISIQLDMWDLAGPERFRTITSAYYRQSHGVFICYDVTDRLTFESLKLWNGEIKKFANPHVMVVVLGLKADAILDYVQDDYDIDDADGDANFRPEKGPAAPRRQVEYREGADFADELGVAFFKCSSKDGINVDNALATMIHHMIPQISQWRAAEQQRQEEMRRLMNRRTGPARETASCGIM